MRIDQLVEAVKNLKIPMIVPHIMSGHTGVFTPKDWHNVATQAFGVLAQDKFGITVVAGEFASGKFTITLESVVPTTSFIADITQLFNQWSRDYFNGEQLYEYTHFSDVGGKTTVLIDRDVQAKAYEDAVLVALVELFPSLGIKEFTYDRKNHTADITCTAGFKTDDYEELLGQVNRLVALQGSTPVEKSFAEVQKKMTAWISDKVEGREGLALVKAALLGAMSQRQSQTLEDMGIDLVSYKSTIMGFGVTEKEFQIIKAHFQVDDNGNDA